MFWYSCCLGAFPRSRGIAGDIPQTLWLTASHSSRREWLYHPGLKFIIPREMFRLPRLGHVSSLDPSAMTDGIRWTLCRDVMWKLRIDKTMCLLNVYTYPPRPTCFCHGPYHLYPACPLGCTSKASMWSTPIHSFFTWLKLLDDISSIASGGLQLVLPSPFPSLHLWRK